MTDGALIKSAIRQNSQLLDILSTEDLINEWKNVTGKDIADLVLSMGDAAANYTAPVLDAIVATRLIKDLGFNGRVVTKTVKGKQYIIFKGLPGTRSIFTGTRYLASNAKVIDMALGRAGIANSVASGARLTVFLVIPIDILKFILDDEQTMFHLIGNISTDLIKVGAASAIAGLAGTAAAAVTTLAAGPLIVAIVVGVAVGLTLDYLDREFGITDRLIQALEDAYAGTRSTMDELYDGTFGVLARELTRLENTLRWQALNGVPVGKGIFY